MKLSILFALFVFLMFKCSSHGATLGERNNNPGNLIYSKSNNWVGQIGKEKGFVKFKTPEHGIRAMKKILDKRTGETVREIVSKWAPPHENKTENYIDFVERKTGFKESKRIQTDEEKFKLIKAIVNMEIGRVPYSDKQIKDGMNLA